MFLLNEKHMLYSYMYIYFVCASKSSLEGEIVVILLGFEPI